MIYPPTSKDSRFRALKKCLKFEAFSLVEVTLAVGLVSFVLISIMGLNSTGLLVLQNAGFDQVSSGIASVLAGEFRATSPDKLKAETRFFDVEGREVATVADGIYKAEVSLQPPKINGAVVDPSQSLRAVKLVVGRVVGGQQRAWVILLADDSESNAP